MTTLCVAMSQLDYIAREVRGQPMQPFGGIQLILCGDFFQLPPVKAKLMAFESPVWNACVTMFVACV